MGRIPYVPLLSLPIIHPFLPAPRAQHKLTMYLGHWAQQETGLYYNNLKHDEIPDPAHVEKNGIHNWTKRGGIVGRGVLIDYVAYAERHNIQYSAVTRHEITIHDIETAAKEQGVEFKPADILIIRSGWVKWHDEADEEARIKGARDGHEHVGVQGSKESVEWLWNHHFAAVAGDAIAFEAWPPKAPYREFARPLVFYRIRFSLFCRAELI